MDESLSWLQPEALLAWVGDNPWLIVIAVLVIAGVLGWRIRRGSIGARHHYLKSLAYARLNDLARAATEMARVSPASTSSWQILAPYISTAVLRRSDRFAGATSTRFHTLLDELRWELERERGQSLLDELLEELERVNRLLLTDDERRQLLRAVETRVVAPLAVYYRGVSHLWLGEYPAAEACFGKYLDMLPGARARSKAHALLKRARSDDVSAPVDDPYSTAAPADYPSSNSHLCR